MRHLYEPHVPESLLRRRVQVRGECEIMARFNSKYLHKTYRIALASMMAALSLIVLYIGILVPNLRVSMYFLSSIFVTPLLLEDQPSMAILEYIAVSLLGLLIVPDLTMVLPYVLLFRALWNCKILSERS